MSDLNKGNEGNQFQESQGQVLIKPSTPTKKEPGFKENAETNDIKSNIPQEEKVAEDFTRDLGMEKSNETASEKESDKDKADCIGPDRQSEENEEGDLREVEKKGRDNIEMNAEENRPNQTKEVTGNNDESNIHENKFNDQSAKETENSLSRNETENDELRENIVDVSSVIKQEDVVCKERGNDDGVLVSQNENNNEDSKSDAKNEGQASVSSESSRDEGSENHSKNVATNKADDISVSKNKTRSSCVAQTADQMQDGDGANEKASAMVESGSSEQDTKTTTEETPTISFSGAVTDEVIQEEPTLAVKDKDIAENKENPGVVDKHTIAEVENQSLVEIQTQSENDKFVQERSEPEMESMGTKSGDGDEGHFEVTTDIIEVKKEQETIDGSVGESDRAPKTPESIAASVDLPLNSPYGRPKSRPLTAESEFVYNELDFPTPDYEVYGPSPEGQIPKRQLSPSKKDRQLASRGESTKNVTFADDISKGSEKGEDDETLEAPPPAVEEGKKEKGQKDDDKADSDSEKDGQEEKKDVPGEETKKKKDEETLDIFPTAVSEEKIEEAKRKQWESITRKESLAIELFGASKFEPETMEDVITKKAYDHFHSGCSLAEKGDFYLAVLCFDKALNLLPKEVQFYLMRGEAYMQLCDFQSAILNLKKACVLQPDNNEYYTRLAFVYYFQGQSLFDQCLFAEALESFSRAAEMKPDVIAYHTRSIACLAALQRHGECLALVNKRLEVERSNPDLYIMRARLHQLFRNSTLCYYDLKDALALDPNQQEARTLMQELEVKAEENRNHAIRLQLQGKFKDSLAKITIAIEMNPSVPEYHLQRGALHRRLHDYNAAIDDFLLAMDKTEHNEHSDIYTNAQRQLLLTYNDFAVECFMGGHFEEAILLLNKALKGEKREKGLYINRGDCFFRLQEFHFSLADYHQALEIDNSDPGIRSRVAAIHSQFGLQDYEEHSYQEAESRFTVAIQHNPRHGPYYISRCKVRLMMENQSGARQDFLMGLHLDPANTDILTLMPRIYPGKSVSDVMRTKHAKDAKIAADNAVMTASPIKLPGLESGATGGGEETKDAEGVKRVTFDPALAENQDTVIPPLKSCMEEMEFNKVLTVEKKRVSSKVKTMLHDRGTLFVKDQPKLKPQPPPRPYAVRGGHWKNPEPPIKPGWKTFSLGVGLME